MARHSACKDNTFQFLLKGITNKGNSTPKNTQEVQEALPCNSIIINLHCLYINFNRRDRGIGSIIDLYNVYAL